MAYAVLSATMAGVVVGSVMLNVYKILISHAIALVVLVLGMILTLLSSSSGVFEANINPVWYGSVDGSHFEAAQCFHTLVLLELTHWTSDYLCFCTGIYSVQ